MGLAEHLDSLIVALAPGWGARRKRAREGNGNLRRYEAAVQTGLAKWTQIVESADAELPWGDRQALLSNLRDLAQNDPHASGALNYRVDSVVGTGIQVKPKILADDSSAPRTEAPITKALAERLNAQLDVAWSRWRRSADVAGRLDWTGILRLLEREVAQSGDGLLHPVYRRGHIPKDQFRLSLEVVDADRLQTPLDRSGQDIRDGIEIGPNGAPVAYYVLPQHPGDTNIIGSNEVARIPASWILHTYDMIRPGQSRGVPWLATIAPLLRRKKKYAELELVAAAINAMFCAFVRTEDPHNTADAMQSGTDAASNRIQEMRAGAIQYLDPNQDVTFGNPTHPNENYDPYMRSVLQEASAGIGMAYESFSGDTTKSTYTSMRAKLLSERIRWRTFQVQLIAQVVKPVYALFVQDVALRGVADIAPELWKARRADLVRCVARAPGSGWVDPEAEVKAFRFAHEGHLRTLESLYAEQGQDWEEELKQLGREKDLQERLGLLEPVEDPDAAAAETGLPLRGSQITPDEGDNGQDRKTCTKAKPITTASGGNR